MGEFPSGQRGQTVNLLLLASVVRIHLLPPNKHGSFDTKLPCFSFYRNTLKSRDFTPFALFLKFHCAVKLPLQRGVFTVIFML